MTQFIMIRHGEPTYEIVQSRGFKGLGHDLGQLTLQGREQAYLRALDNELKDAELIISSPYTRALETAAIISRITGIPLQVENDLHEWLIDTTMVYEIDDYRKASDEFWQSKGIRSKDTLYPWESIDSVKNRVDKVLEKYLDYKKVIVVCHGIVINSQTFLGDNLGYCDKRIILKGAK